jgi:hypothetical protein
MVREAREMKETRFEDGETVTRPERGTSLGGGTRADNIQHVQSWMDCRDWTGIKRDRLNSPIAITHSFVIPKSFLEYVRAPYRQLLYV